MSTTTLAEALDDYAPAVAAPSTPADLAVRRAFMAGSLAALALIQHQGRRPSELLAECIAYGRSIGTAAETAS